MKAPKILAVASAVDLDFRYGCTPAWWQLWKGMYQAGIDLIVTPYRGRAVESPWWRTAPNPCYREAELYASVRGLTARLKGDTLHRRAEEHPEDTPSDRIVREVIWRYVTPRWQRHLERILEREGDVDAVIVFTVPMSHLRGIPTALRERFGVPVVFYDGDVPMSLPEFGGMDMVPQAVRRRRSRANAPRATPHAVADKHPSPNSCAPHPIRRSIRRSVQPDSCAAMLRAAVPADRRRSRSPPPASRDRRAVRPNHRSDRRRIRYLESRAHP